MCVYCPPHTYYFHNSHNVVLYVGSAVMPLCVRCGKDAEELRCARCKTTTYCSDACQRADWFAGHRTTCENLVGSSDAVTSINADGNVVASVAPDAAVTSAAVIFVDGNAIASMEPDVAIVSVAVEVKRQTVQMARGQAATSMAAIAATLEEHNVSESDIQTRRFSITPVYDRATSDTSVELGYRVVNQSMIKIRDMDQVGAIIDAVAAAGGDAVRIDGIQYTVEDTSEIVRRLRDEAVNDAMEKARHLAHLTHMQLGRLVTLSEGAAIHGQNRTMTLMAREASSTDVSAGEMEVRMSVSASFAIE